MTKGRITFLWTVLLCPMLLLWTACGGGSGSASGGGGSNALSSSASWMTGNWQITMERGIGDPKPTTQSGFLVANKNAISGSLLIGDATCSGVGSASGTITGTSIAMVVSGVGQTITLNGALGSDKASMGGDYATLASGCGTSETGTWIASLVQPLGGNLGGNFTSNSTAIVAPVAGQVSQAQNAVGTSASVTGNFSATGSSCISTANISGLLTGTSLVMNLLDANGNQIGQVAAALDLPSLNGTASAQGTYRILPLTRNPKPPQPPCVAGELGTVCLVTGATGVTCTTTSLSGPGSSVKQGDDVTFSVTVTSIGPNLPTGSVTFRDGNATLGAGPVALGTVVSNCATPPAQTSGTASLCTNSLTAGPHLITAVYGGDGNSAASTSNVVGQVVNGLQ